MNRYRVIGGVARIGVGDVVGLDEAQYGPRAHNVDVVKKSDGLIFVRPKIPLDFKVGEEIVLAAIGKNLVGIVEPLHKSESKVDALAVKAVEENPALREAGAKKAGKLRGERAKAAKKPAKDQVKA